MGWLVVLTWFWVNTPSPAWRLPEHAVGLAIVDKTRAVAVTYDSLMTIDLSTGVVDAPVKVVKSGKLDSIVLAGDRLLGFGMVGSKPAAWELTLAPPASTPLPYVDAGGVVSRVIPSATLQPDGKTILVCASERAPTLRDATTLAVVAIAPADADCDATRNRLRKLPLPVGVVRGDIAGDRAVVLVNEAVLVVSLKTNKVLAQPAGHISRIRQVAPRGGSVITLADKLRVWRDGRVTRVAGDAHAFAVGDAKDPVAVFGWKNVALWDPDRNTSNVNQPAGIGDLAFARDGAALAFSTGKQLWLGTTTTQAAAWMTLRDSWSADAIDRARRRIAVHDARVTAIIDDDTGSVSSLAIVGVRGCEPARQVKFSPDGSRIVIEGPRIFSSTGAPIGEVELPRLMRLAWDFLPTGELVVVGTNEIAIFDPSTGTAVGWQTPIDELPVDLGIDPSGNELAVGYNDGNILWVDVRELRANAVSRPARLTPIAACKHATPKLADIVE
jgi:hypothetical protein